MGSDEPTKNNGEDNVVAMSTEVNQNITADGDGGNHAADVNVYIADNEQEPASSREEGELSSNSDDYQETHSATKFPDSNDATQPGSVQVASLNEMSQDAKSSDICNLTNKPSSMVYVSSGAHPQLDHHKGSERNRGQFVPFVIRFSDDDSESDSDDSRNNTSESKGNTQGADQSRRLPPLSLQKSQELQQNRVREARGMSRQVSGHPAIFSKVKTGGASGNAEQISSFRNLSYEKKGAGQDQQYRTNVHLNPAKMQDLREQIEFRENQIKLKTNQQTKSQFTGFHGNNNARNLSNPVSRVCKTDQVHESRSNVNNPDKKRQKTGEPRSRKDCLDCHNFVGDMLPLKKSTLHNYGNQSVEDRRHCGEDNTLKTSDASHLEEQKQNARHAQHTSTNPLIVGKEGPQIVANSLVDDMNAEIVSIIASPAQTGQIGKRPAGDFRSKLVPADHSGSLNCLDKLNTNESDKLDITSLLHYEDMLDKELEETQDNRRKCEIEERNALTAYRKAHRALVEANAQCFHLYKQREIYSTQLRSLMMENPNKFFSSRPHDQSEAGLSFPNKTSDVGVHLIPSSSHHNQATFNINSGRDFHSKIPLPDSAFQNLSHLHVEGQNLFSNPGVEANRSSLEAHRRDDVSNGVCCSDNLNESADDDDEICQLDPNSAQDNLESAQTSECDTGRKKYRIDGSQGQLSFDSPQDSLLLEASLRSQLYEKLRAKKLLRRGVNENTESATDGVKMIGTVVDNAPLCEAEIDKHSDIESANKEDRFSQQPVPFSSHSDMIPSDHASPDIGEPRSSNFLLEGSESTISVTLCPTIRSVFIHLKVTKPLGTLQLQNTCSDILSSGVNEMGRECDICNKSQTIRLGEDPPEETTLGFRNGLSGYYSGNVAIDPLWPLCMFELRGKCNNDECCWQHVKDYSCVSTQPDTIDGTECQVQKQLQREEFSSTSSLSMSLDHHALAPPTYVVGSDVLRPNSQSYTSLLAEDYGQCWQKCFSTFLVLSSLFATTSGSNEPFLHGTEARIDVQSDWTRQSSYFHSRNSRLVDQFSADQSLEMALLNFSKQANKQKGRVEALKVLVPAIEANSRSAVLWMVYLQIYYFNQKTIGKDDLFKWAVEFNMESYELWLMYINSREQLEDQLAAYDAALSALSRHSFAVNSDALLVSQCILDIFLQMLDFMCRSGNVGNAIEKISGLIVSTKNSDKPYQSMLDDVISCLTICDKFVFWISCVYLVVYKELPHPVVQSFECWKESFTIEWPDVNLTCDEKQQAVSLMEMAVDSLMLYMDSESLETEKTLRAAHLFALNHVRCVSVLEGLVCSRLMLEKYIKLYPTCLDLVLMAARAEYYMGGPSFDQFEAALRNWPDKAPGLQCIWNQYAECALQSGKFDFVKELMERWFHSVRKAQDLHHEVLHANSSGDSITLPQSTSASDLCAWFSGYNQTDRVFGMLNLSLYRVLQNDHIDALFALNQAVRSASADNYCHCLRELAIFLLSNSIQQYGEVHVKHILSILNVHMPDGRAWVAAEPLSRGFIQKIGRPRVRQLVSKMLRPVSADFSLMYMVVDVWDGLLRLPQMYDNIVSLVDFVEGMMEIMPSNYLLAISVGKLLIKSSTLKDSASTCFWASSLLVNALFHAVPVAPEYIWVESADVLFDLTNSQKIGKSFHKKALSVYPFSTRLWKSYLRISEDAVFRDSVRATAREKGILLN